LLIKLINADLPFHCRSGYGTGRVRFSYPRVYLRAYAGAGARGPDPPRLHRRSMAVGMPKMEMSMSEETKLSWHTVDIANLNKEEVAMWDKMKATYKAYVELRTNFEKAITPSVRNTLDARDQDEVKFGYRFDQLSVALAPVTVRKGKNVLTLKRK